MIVDYSVGHTGSVHDSWAFRSTQTFREHDQVFLPGEWMWVDSAYPSEVWSVSPFKKPARGELTRDQRTFNYHLSKVNVNTVSRVSTVTHSTNSIDLHPCRTRNWPSERQVSVPVSAPHSSLHLQESYLGDHVGSLLHHTSQHHLAYRSRELRSELARRAI